MTDLPDFARSIKADRFDLRAFEQVKASTPEVKKFCTDKGGIGEAFAGDIFSSLFKMNPQLDEEVTEAEAPHLPIIKEMRDLPQYAQFRETTKLDKLSSALATVELANALGSKLPDPNKDKGRWKEGKYVPAAAAARPEDGEALRSVVRRVLKKTMEKVEEQLEAYEAIIGQGRDKGQAGTEDIGQVQALYHRVANSHLLKQIAKIAGRMRLIAARKHAERTRRGPDEVADIEAGRELTRTLPSELALMEVAPTEFLRKYAEGELLQVRMEGREVKGRGPIILCLDSSDSMYQGKPVTREVWAKAMALGLMTIAAKERREFVLITFGTACQVFDFGAKPQPTEIMNALSFRYERAGTAFDPPLTEALIALGYSEKADVVFLTDGQASVSQKISEEIRAAKVEQGMKLFVVTIGTTDDASLRPLADGIAHLVDLSKDDQTLDMIFGV
jgi:uncharacterized protein with von Willebrand factor type A (vWA) domain